MPRADLLAGWQAEPIRVGLSGASVERWTRPGGDEVRFHKSGPTTWDRGLDAEAERLRWLAGTSLADRVATVVLHEVDDDGTEHLVTTAVLGRDGAERAEAAAAGLGDGEHLARRFGAALRELHDTLDAAACPFDRRLDVRLAAAARRAEEGGVDPAEFEPEYADRTPAELLDLLVRTRPTTEDLVVTHSDWCYPNVVFDDDDGWSMVDLADLGVADRWYDVGIGARSTVHNLGQGAVPAFLEGYGREPDHERIRYYVVLDELQ